eukprot:GFUD01007901.1.p1 GENE.GFUD01007901.1~~GFUD01007901.1.p1  ORF type:complete len:539 (+),score=172.53 GFUD01007901.1:31-1617(+)
MWQMLEISLLCHQSGEQSGEEGQSGNISMEGVKMKFSRLKEDQVMDDDNPENGITDTLLVSDGILKRLPRAIPWKSILACLAIISLTIFISCNKVDIDTRYETLITSLNLSNTNQQSLRMELQKVGEMLNIARTNLSRLERGHDRLKNRQPWKSDLDDVRKDITNKITESVHRIEKAEQNITSSKNVMDDLKVLLSNNSGEIGKLKSNDENVSNRVTELTANSHDMATIIHQRIDRVSNDTTDMSINHEELKDNIYEQIASIEFRQEIMEEEAEQNLFNQESTNEDFELEILKLETALNMTVTHWADLKSGHSEFANKTLSILNSLVEISSRTTTEAYEEIDSVEAIEENDTTETGNQQISSSTESSSVIGSTTATSKPVFQNCTNAKKIQPNAITCEASSEFNRKFSCRKAFDGNLSIGKKKNAWASKGEGVGAWIMANFDQTIAVNQLKILQRHFPGESNKKVEIQFSSGLKQLATLPAKGDKHWNIIRLSNGVLTDSVKITVMEVYGTVNNGFKEIQVFGCSDIL